MGIFGGPSSGSFLESSSFFLYFVEMFQHVTQVNLWTSNFFVPAKWIKENS